jgi:formate dehydrogenase gamma subunit
VSADDKILRFRDCERHLHWAIAIPFKICYLTALILVVVYNPHPHRPLREVVSWIHRLSGISLATLPPLSIAWHWREWRVHFENVRVAWSWSFDDLKWLALMGPSTVSSRVVLPDQDKFNAAEKINFMSLTLTYPAYVMTGVTIWFFAPAYLAWLIHFSLALLATPLIAGHVFMATINPETRVGLEGMITGWVDRHWASHHYALWYRDLHGDTTAPVVPAAPVVYLPASMRVPPAALVQGAPGPDAAARAPRAGPVGGAPERDAGRAAVPETVGPAVGGRTSVFAAS